MPPSSKVSWRRRLNQKAPVVSTLTGLLIIYSGFVLFADDTLKLIAVTIGLVFLEIGLWYGANPVLTSERRYQSLREEVDRFIKLVRKLNMAVVEEMGEEEVTRVKDSMHASVETMYQLAGKTKITD
ncbi:MAG: hypothetical protein AB4040_03180 [Synechococcus sp.]